jgi:hypothetical protein
VTTESRDSTSSNASAPLAGKPNQEQTKSVSFCAAIVSTLTRKAKHSLHCLIISMPQELVDPDQVCAYFLLRSRAGSKD